MSYVKSQDIKLFPSAFRGKYDTTGNVVFNPASRLTTEQNLTSFASIASSEHHSFVVEYDSVGVDKTITVRLKGYLFTIKMAPYLSSFTSNIWAKIKLVNVATDDPIKPNTVDTAPVLRPVIGAGNILDSGTADGDFIGISLTETEETGTDIYSFKILENVGSGWSVPESSMLKKASTEISNVKSGVVQSKAISNEFDTNLLTVGKINGLTVETTTGTLNIADAKTLSAKVNLTVGASSTYTGPVTVRSAGTSATIIEGPNNGTATLVSGTMVGTGNSQTLTNKTLTTPKINDTSSNHTYNIAVSELAENRTVTLPLLTENDEFVFKDFTQTLKNKTLTSPTLTTPSLGVATATSINKVAITAPATGSTLTIAEGKTLTANDSVTLAGTGTATFNKNLTVSNDNAITLTASDANRTLTVSGANKELAGAGTKLTLGNSLSLAGTTGAISLGTGTNTLTLATSGNTSVTLPVSGTLATTANIQALDATGTATFGAGKTISAWSETDGIVSITSQDISITSSQISDKTNTYSPTGTVAVTGTAVAAALGTLDASGDSFGADQTINVWSQSNGIVSISKKLISITKSQISDFPNRAASSTDGGSATTATTTSDVSNTLYPVGVTSSSTTTLKRNTGISMVGGALTANTVTATNFYATSDRRLKENIVDYKYHDSILDLTVKEFDYKESGIHAIGFIAQELQEKFPELVKEDEKGYLSISENKLVYLLLEEVKMLKEEIKKLKEE